MASAAAFLAQGLYREFFESVLSLALSEEYSYVVVLLITVLAVVYLSVRRVGFSYGVRVSKLISSSFLASLAVLMYLLSVYALDSRVHLQGLSFALLFVSMTALVYDPVSPAHVIPLLTVFLLVPLPTSVVDSVTPVLSRVVGWVAAAVTGSRLVDAPTHVVLEVTTPDGVYQLSVEPACTGVVTLGSVVAAVPVLVLMASVGRANPRRRALASALVLTLALLIGFLGNLLRVLAVVYAARSAGVGVAVDLFHHPPSALYSSLSVAVAFLVVSRYGGLGGPYEARRDGGPDVSWGYVLGVLALALAMVSVVATAAVAAGGALVGNGGGEPAIVVDDLGGLVADPAAHLGTEEVAFLSASYDGYLTRVLGALAVYRVSVEFSGRVYTGYVELVDTPAKLHTWQLCLSLQGYRVEGSWSRSHGTLQVNYVVAEAGGVRHLLTHALVPVVARSGEGGQRLFARLSVFTPSEDLAASVEDSTRLVLAAVGADSGGTGPDAGALDALYAASYALLALLAVYLLLVGTRQALTRVR